MKTATPREIIILASAPGIRVFVRLAGSFRINMSVDLEELRTVLRHQNLSLNQPMEIAFEMFGNELFINELNIQP